jgi:hypothetical protein
VRIAVPVGDKALPWLLAAARQAPTDPGSEQTVALGPDGVAVGVAAGSGITGSNPAGGAGAVTRSVVEVYDGPVSQVSRTLTMIGNTKIKVCTSLSFNCFRLRERGGERGEESLVKGGVDLCYTSP